MIMLSYCDSSLLADAGIGRLLKRLPAFLHAEVTRYHQAIDRKSRLLARMMLLDAMAQSGVRLSEERWQTNSFHKPMVSGWRHFNISHSGNQVVLAHSEWPVGIDTEWKNGTRYTELLHIFHAEEKAFIVASPNPDEAFYALWSKKEALLKAAGIGLVNDLHAFSCLNNEIWYRGERWFFYETGLMPEYTCFLCSNQPHLQVISRRYDIPGLPET